MKSHEDIRERIERLCDERMSKKDLEKELQKILETDNHLEEATDVDDKDRDYIFIMTNAEYPEQKHQLCDVEIEYLKLRKRGWVLVTFAEILTYIE